MSELLELPSATLLQTGDPVPVELFNPNGTTPLMLVCDHASRAIPRRLGDLGVPKEELARHIGYDIGAAGVARLLAEAFDAPLVLSGFSRLVIDLNRALDDPTSIPPVSDGTPVPGNQDLADADRAARVHELFAPYHRAVAACLDGFSARGARPSFLSVHTCTPVMAGFARPWHVGVLWNRDDRMAGPLIAALARDPTVCVGDNLPYSGRSPRGYTVPAHAEARGLPHVSLEIRQDLVSETGGIADWARRLYGALEPIVADLASA